MGRMKFCHLVCESGYDLIIRGFWGVLSLCKYAVQAGA
jgi:hypothetical protein